MARATTLSSTSSLHPNYFWKEAKTPSYLLPSLVPSYRSPSTTAAAATLCRVQDEQGSNIFYDHSTPRSHCTKLSHQQDSGNWKSNRASPVSNSTATHCRNETCMDIVGSEEYQPVLTVSKANVELHYIRRRNVSVPKFLRCLYEILQEEDPMIIAWSHRGTAFQVKQPTLLAAKILPNYFKHRNVSSFQRQLNYFGFKKWTKTQTDICTFSHPCFVRDNKEKMRSIKRKERKMYAGTFVSPMTTGLSSHASQQSSLRGPSCQNTNWNATRENYVEYRESFNHDLPSQTMRNSSNAEKSATPYVLNMIFPQVTQPELYSSNLNGNNNRLLRDSQPLQKERPDYSQTLDRSGSSSIEQSTSPQSDVLLSFDNIISEFRPKLRSPEENRKSYGSQIQWIPSNSLRFTYTKFAQANPRQCPEHTQRIVANDRQASYWIMDATEKDKLYSHDGYGRVSVKSSDVYNKLLACIDGCIISSR